MLFSILLYIFSTLTIYYHFSKTSTENEMTQLPRNGRSSFEWMREYIYLKHQYLNLSFINKWIQNFFDH